MIDQAVLGLVSVLLAWRVGVAAFVPLSALLIINSLAITLSDFGLGSDVLRQGPGVLSMRSIKRLRTLNSIPIIGLILVALVFNGDIRTICLGTAFIWPLSAEAYVRKSALIVQEKVGRVALAEIAGASFVMGGLASALVLPRWALPLMATTLAVKLLVEIAALRGWRATFEGSADRWDLWIWTTNVLSYAIMNVDYLAVALLLSPEAFAIYSLAFRIASVFVSQVTYIVAILSLVDFGVSHRSSSLEMIYPERRAQIFKFGVLASVVTAMLATALVTFLGSEWTTVLPIAAVLALGVPWRACEPVGINLLVAVGRARGTTRWELLRLVMVVAILAMGAQFGLSWFTLGALTSIIIAANGYDQLAGRATNVVRLSPLFAATPVALSLALVITIFQ